MKLGVTILCMLAAMLAVPTAASAFIVRAASAGNSVDYDVVTYLGRRECPKGGNPMANIYVRVSYHGLTGRLLFRWTHRLMACHGTFNGKWGRIVWAKSWIGHFEGHGWDYKGIVLKDGRNFKKSVWRLRKGKMTGEIPVVGASQNAYPWARLTLTRDPNVVTGDFFGWRYRFNKGCDLC